MLSYASVMFNVDIIDLIIIGGRVKFVIKLVVSLSLGHRITHAATAHPCAPRYDMARSNAFCMNGVQANDLGHRLLRSSGEGIENAPDVAKHSSLKLWPCCVSVIHRCVVSKLNW